MEGLGSRFVRFFTGKPGAYNPASAVYRDYYFTMGRRVEDYYNEREKINQRYKTLSDKLKSGEELTQEESSSVRDVIRKRAIYKEIDARLKIYRTLDLETDAEQAKKQRDRLIELLNRVDVK